MILSLSALKRLSPFCFPLVCWGLLGLGLLQGCSETDDQVRIPAKELYNQAFIAAEDAFYTEAEEKFQKLTQDHPGTRLATLAYLKLGDLNFERAKGGSNKWADAEANYKLFLTFNPNSHLTPYVLNRLISLNYERNVKGIFFKSRDFDRDMEPNRKIIQDYQRFFLLYPQNAYIEDVREYLVKARSDLAEHEFLVGNFYFAEEAYDSAILRYLHLLKEYPEYPRTQEVGERLIAAYRKNQQPHLAEEFEKVLHLRFASGRKTG